VEDRELVEQITKLVAEEQHLQEQDHHDVARLREVEVMLDQLWDLLRQRRSREEFGLDPNQARPRDPEIVERYQQ